METDLNPHHGAAPHTQTLQRGFYYIISPVPVPLINRILSRLVAAIAAKHPDIFNRLDGHHHKWFTIDPDNMPFQFYLLPDPLHPKLKCRRRKNPVKTDGKISGSLLTLLGMIDGRYDGDALFFTRNLRVEGDTEAIVCLRNALDDVEGSIAGDIADFFGPPGNYFLKIARMVSAHD